MPSSEMPSVSSTLRFALSKAHTLSRYRQRWHRLRPARTFIKLLQMLTAVRGTHSPSQSAARSAPPRKLPQRRREKMTHSGNRYGLISDRSALSFLHVSLNIVLKEQALACEPICRSSDGIDITRLARKALFKR